MHNCSCRLPSDTQISIRTITAQVAQGCWQCTSSKVVLHHMVLTPGSSAESLPVLGTVLVIDTGVRHKGQGCLRCATRLAQSAHVTQWLQGWKSMLAGRSMQTMQASSSASSGWLAAIALAAIDAMGVSFWSVGLEARICPRTCEQRDQHWFHLHFQRN